MSQVFHEKTVVQVGTRIYQQCLTQCEQIHSKEMTLVVPMLSRHISGKC
jgi:hypothetical protein